MQVEHGFSIGEAALEYIQHTSSFLAAGAVGFRFAAVRGRDDDMGYADDERLAYRDALAVAARLGLAGILFNAWRWTGNLPRMADRMHMAVGELLTHDVPTMVRAILLLLGVVGFLLAATRRPVGWPLAALGILAPLANASTGQFQRLANPLHVLVGGLWIGTLLVLVVAGITRALRLPDATRRGGMVADMVNGFSPLALVAGGALVLSGVWTAWRHLGSVAALGTSDYGRALLVKLAFVAIVFGLGAFNWRRQRPTLGTEATALRIRRSSILELGAAAAVLLVTVYLLQQEAPAEAGRRGPPGASPPAGAPASAAPAAPTPATPTP